MSAPSNESSNLEHGKPIESNPVLFFLDEDGLFRVKRLFSETINGEVSGEAGIIFKCWWYGLATGGIYGSTIGIKPTYLDFKNRFNEYQFQGKHAYARKLFDCTASTLMRNGIRVAWRTSLLTTLFSASACTLSVYHNDIRFTDLMFSFAISGGFYTFHRGPKAMLAGATLSALMGIPFAGLAKLFLWASGITYAELSDKSRGYYDAPSIQRQKKIQRAEILWRQESIPYKDNYKSYIFHQRRVDRLEKAGIVDDSFKQLKPGKAQHPKEFEKS